MHTANFRWQNLKFSAGFNFASAIKLHMTYYAHVHVRGSEIKPGKNQYYGEMLTFPGEVNRAVVFLCVVAQEGSYVLQHGPVLLTLAV